jgi:succinyl-diaminopimelate desuccinylase
MADGLRKSGEVRRESSALGGTLLNADTAARLVSELVRFRSVNPPGEEAPCARYVAEYLKQAGIDTRLVEHPFAHRPQVLGVLGSGASPVLALNGHMDVVPEGDIAEWSHDPYAGEVVGDRVYGRGTTDMKGGLAAMMLAGRALSAESTGWKGTLLLQFVIGEEMGESGTLEILKEEPRPDRGIVLEASQLMVGVAARGLTWWEMVAHGRPAHVGTPAGGLNAIDLAAGLLANVAKYRAELAERQAHPLLGPPDCAATMISGGTKENVLADRCRVVLDRRMIPGETVSQVEREISALWPAEAQSHCETRCLQVYTPAEIDPEDPLVHQIRKSVQRVTGRDPGFYGETASTDARNFINDFGIPAVIWGPGELDGSHVADEWIAADQVSLTAEALVDICRAMLA